MGNACHQASLHSQLPSVRSLPRPRPTCICCRSDLGRNSQEYLCVSGSNIRSQHNHQVSELHWGFNAPYACRECVFATSMHGKILCGDVVSIGGLRMYNKPQVVKDCTEH
jgi:hypothetical protein